MSDKSKVLTEKNSNKALNAAEISQCEIEQVMHKQPEEPLHVKCKKRYNESRLKYHNFFLKCVKEIEDLQPSGFASVQIDRYFTVGILPEYCRIPDPLTPKERERVEKLLAD